MRSGRVALAAFAVVLMVAFKKLNGIFAHLESRGFQGDYQFWDDLGNDLAMAVPAICVWMLSGSKIIRRMGLVMAMCVIADCAGLWLSPDHYDGWAWEIGSAAFGVAFALAAGVMWDRRERPTFRHWGSPPQKPSPRIGFDYRGRK